MHGDHSTRYFRMVEGSGFKNGMKLPSVSGNSLCGFPYEENAQLKECHCGTSVKLKSTQCISVTVLLLRRN